MQERNSLIEPEDFFAGYKEKIENLKNDPKVIEFDKLCFELFHMNEMGKRFLEIIKERYIVPALAKPGTPTYQLDVMWGEGFKDFGRMLISSIASHQQKILSGK